MRAPGAPPSTEPAPISTQNTQPADQVRVYVAPERILTLPDIPDVDLTPIYTAPEGVAVAVDLVFVHGLMGKPLKTWLCGKIPKKKSAADNGKGEKLLKALEPSSILKTLGRKKGKHNEAVEGEAEAGTANPT